MATIVIGTAGHIDHGKTTLLRALTGIDADRLPEERERGMTIDVGFAHLLLDDGTAIDFVDVPGHDRLVGNMLVGAGEIDGVLLVVAADDGPRAQTLEHLELLDALGIERAVVALTKVDAVEPGRVREVATAVRALIDRTGMAGAAIVAASGVTGDGVAELRNRLTELRDALLADAAAGPAGPLRLPIDRAFAVRGRGAVVTGTLRGGAVAAGAVLRLEPAGAPAARGRGVVQLHEVRVREVRVREVQVHHGRAERSVGGRVALNLAGIEVSDLRRGQVLTAGEGIEATDRVLAVLRRPARLAPPDRSAPWPPAARVNLRLHLWTESVEASIGPTGARWVPLDGATDLGGGVVASPGGTVAAIVRLDRPIAALVGARAVLRDPGSGQVVSRLTILDNHPPRGVSRHRATPGRLTTLATAVQSEPAVLAAALTDLHGFRGGELAPDVREALEAIALEGARAGERAEAGASVADLRAQLLRELRRPATVDRASANTAVVAVERVLADLVAAGRLVRDADRLIDSERRLGAADELAAAMARLEAALDVNVPPSLADAARAASCPPEGLRALEASGRIVRVEDDLAWSSTRYASLREVAVEAARRGPLSPASFRDAIGGNRRVALAFLEDLGRRGILRRTEAGHVLGPRALR